MGDFPYQLVIPGFLNHQPYDQIHISEPKEMFDPLLGEVAGGRGGPDSETREDFLEKTPRGFNKKDMSMNFFAFLFCFLHVYWYLF